MKINPVSTSLADPNTSQPLAAPSFGSKRDVARMVGMSIRTVDNLMAEGMPHLRLGSRRTRFDMAEVAAWLREKYRVQRRRSLRQEVAE